MERLARAQESRDLGESIEGAGDVDWLRASGMVAQRHGLALSLMRLVEGRDKRELNASFRGMLALVPAGESSPAMTVSHVLAWMLDPLCKGCGGRGYPVMVGAPVLAALPCKACEGEGQARPGHWGAAERDLHHEVQGMIDEASRAIARKMAQ